MVKKKHKSIHSRLLNLLKKIKAADNSFYDIIFADAVKGWLDRSAEKERAKNDQMMDRIEHLRYKQSACFTVNTDVLLRNLNREPIKNMVGLEALQYIAVSMDMDKAFKLRGQSQFTSAKKAELFRNALKGIIAAGKLSLSEDRWLLDVLNAIKVDQ